jgi:CRP/FNR family transcriptional regulator
MPGLDEASRLLVEREGMALSAPAGMRVFEPGQRCEMFHFLTKGVIKVQIVAASGREIVLYRVGPGESCVMTVSCMIGEGLYNGEGIVEEDVEGYAIGLPLFNRLLSSSEAFRSHILQAYSQRFTNLVSVLEDVAFRPLDVRLAARLLELAGAGGGGGAGGAGEAASFGRMKLDGAMINVTHQFLATDLGSAREVISRQLKRWEDEGIVAIERGRIGILAAAALAAIAGLS